MLQFQQVLGADSLKTVQEALAEPSAFVSGDVTAGAAASAVKHNQQIPEGPRQSLLRRTVETALRSHDAFMAAARPKAFVRVMFSRYASGMAYGRHLDEPVMGGMRTDLSFTLFLTPPEDYDGGALVVEGPEGEAEVRMNAGDLVLYPTSAVHRVTPVTRGERLACVGWVRSLVRRQEERKILFDLDQVARDILARDGSSSDLYLTIARARNSLIRLWAED